MLKGIIVFIFQFVPLQVWYMYVKPNAREWQNYARQKNEQKSILSYPLFQLAAWVISGEWCRMRLLSYHYSRLAAWVISANGAGWLGFFLATENKRYGRGAVLPLPRPSPGGVWGGGGKEKQVQQKVKFGKSEDDSQRIKLIKRLQLCITLGGICLCRRTKVSSTRDPRYSTQRQIQRQALHCVLLVQVKKMAPRIWSFSVRNYQFSSNI